MSAYYVVGNSLDVLRKMPDDSVDLVLTSPPFLALRSYLPADDPNKPFEIGQESTPGEFLDVLLDLTEELARVLAPHGSLCVELGDTFSGSGGAGGDYAEGGLREGQPTFRQSGWNVGERRERNDSSRWRKQDDATLDTPIISGGPGWPNAKSLCLIPELYRFALAYGFNPLTGRQTPRWRVRNVVRWVRPNPPVGALGDKFRPATSEMVVACKARDRYFDLDAVREFNNPQRMDEPSGGRPHMEPGLGNQSAGSPGGAWNPAGAPPLDWWEIPTEPYAGSHYATFPRALVVRPVKSMCPEKVCRTCGEPSRRITELTNGTGRLTERYPETERRGNADDTNAWKAQTGDTCSQRITLGWSDCGHDDDWRPGRVLDPFAGSGTTLAVAVGHGRTAIGIDLDSRNVDLARERVGGLFFQHVDDLDEVFRG